ncbi:zinc-dependent alcohol dehydrogenase [Parahaliea aestuarii]|uniref:Alcohol dehydrogenase catalytic domain-containing protein n=1 Tax=Parahaliea aestuarii TaxID=1852021 RepID=A0A5C9A357_9GAMM|nr:zinc-binding dehydrogenase [Parahaliea aestuarii]TXS94509.1 alcohol dehydrogenase catalytic domain-containing protein [Parahaliea aestuarii]
MPTMTAARIHAPQDIRLDTVDIPRIGPRDVLVRVVHCGICGSDLSYSKIGGIPGAHLPFAFGHEFSGTIEALGEQVTHLQVGDRVVVNPEAGGNGIGSDGLRGAFAPLVQVRNVTPDSGSVFKLPDHLDFEIGALVEPLSVGMHAANQGRIGAGDRVVVMGAGPVGLAAAIGARHLGAASVCVVDRSEHRLGVARQLGLNSLAADGNPAALAEGLKALHGTVQNDPRLGEQPATDVYIEATGAGPVFQQICATARKGGRIVVVGVHFAPVELDMVNLLMRELQITAAMEYPVEFPQVIDMLCNGSVDVRPLVSHHFPLSDFDTAFAQAQRPDEAVKVLVDCQA